MSMNPGFAAYLAAKKTSKAQAPQAPALAAMPVQPSGMPQVHAPGLPQVGKRHAKVKMHVQGASKHSPTC